MTYAKTVRIPLIFLVLLLVLAMLLAWSSGVQGQTQGKRVSAKRSTPVRSSKKTATTNTTQAKPSRGRNLYQSHCASCHEDGGNLVVPSKPIIGSHVLATGATFKSYLDLPVGTMPHYEDLIKDDGLLNDLYVYVRSLKAVPLNKNDEKTIDLKPSNKQK